jgi:nucleotide-binding universal stress UspA family protein
LPIRTVLFATDFSEGSQFVFRLASSIAGDYSARLVVATVAEPPPFVTYGEMEKAFQDPVGYKQEIQENLHRFRALDPKVKVEYRLEQGDPVNTILRLAQEYPVDLIVMGTHGRKGLGRLLMGSVAEAALRKAPCLVLTVRTPSVAKEAVEKA